jgi:hypothetical protein
MNERSEESGAEQIDVHGGGRDPFHPDPDRPEELNEDGAELVEGEHAGPEEAPADASTTHDADARGSAKQPDTHRKAARAKRRGVHASSIDPHHRYREAMRDLAQERQAQAEIHRQMEAERRYRAEKESRDRAAFSAAMARVMQEEPFAPVSSDILDNAVLLLPVAEFERLAPAVDLSDSMPGSRVVVLRAPASQIGEELRALSADGDRPFIAVLRTPSDLPDVVYEWHAGSGRRLFIARQHHACWIVSRVRNACGWFSYSVPQCVRDHEAALEQGLQSRWKSGASYRGWLEHLRIELLDPETSGQVSLLRREAKAREDATRARATRIALLGVESPVGQRLCEIPSDDGARTLVASLRLRQRHTAMLFGPPGSGKTTFVEALTEALITGDELLGERCPKARVAYLGLEDYDGLVERFRSRAGVGAWANKESDWNKQFLLFGSSPPLADAAALTQWCEKIHASYGEFDVLVIDTWSQLLGALAIDENNPAVAIAGLKRIVAYLGCAIVVLHHTGRSGDHERGGTHLKGGADLCIPVTKESGEDGTLVVRLALSREDLAKMRGRALPKRDVVMTFKEVAGVLKLERHADVAPAALRSAGKAARANASAKVLLVLTQDAQDLAAITDASGLPRSTTHAALAKLSKQGKVLVEACGKKKAWRLPVQP